MFILFLEFVALAVVIFFSGKQLSYYGDMIAGLLGLGKAWIGLVLLASVTSLPEVSVGISAVTVVGSPDLALGDLLGACVFNLFILSMLDAFVPGVPLSSKASSSHILAAAMSIVLIALVGLSLSLPSTIIISSWIGLSSILFVITYFISLRILYFYELKLASEASAVKASQPSTVSLRHAILFYLFNAIVVIGAALFLPGIAERIAVMSGWGESFVGTLFLAASTALPECAVSISAVRMGAFDLAVGNLFGSILFNILILSIVDLFYTQGYLLKDASDINIVSVFSVIIMTAVAIAGLIYRSQKKRYFLAWDALIIGGVYVGNLFLLFYLRNK